MILMTTKKQRRKMKIPSLVMMTVMMTNLGRGAAQHEQEIKTK